MHSLDQMLKADSVAVVGASTRPGSVGEQTMRQLIGGGFTGSIYPVNPSHESVQGLRCHPSITEIGHPIDLVILAVPNASLEVEMEKAVAVGAGSVTIFASCLGVATTGEPLRDRIADLANGAGMAICGGNGMGFVNLEQRLRVCGFYQPADLERGGVTFLSHSGSLFSAMLHNRRRLGFNLVVSTGLEMNTRMSDYMRWALDLESTRVIALFLETVRDPDGFRSALTEAESRQIPVVALKVGASSRGKLAVATHSEAIAGEDAVFEAVFEAHGVHRAQTVEEMVDTVELLSAGRAATATGLGAVHDSGGERALLIDIAERVGVTLPELAEATTERIAQLLDPGLEPANPIDAWGTGQNAIEVFTGCMLAMADDPSIGVIAFAVDLTAEESLDNAYGVAALTAASQTAKPLVVLANMTGTVDQLQADLLRRGGVPVLEGTESGLRAIRHLMSRLDRAWRGPRGPRLTKPVSIEDWDTERGALRLLSSYGIPVPGTIEVEDEEDAVSAGDHLGYPVVLKTVGLDHKTEHGGVVIGLGNADQLRSAYVEMASRLGRRALVSEQVEAGVEIGIGLITDSQFGPVTVVAAGGSLIEVLTDRVALLPPVEVARAREAVDRLAIRPLLDGGRGRAPANLDALADVIARFSELCVDCIGLIDSIDVNPVIVGPGGAVAVDALMKASK